MPEIPSEIMTGAMIVTAVWIALILATVWLLRTSESRREKIRKKMVAGYFRGAVGDAGDEGEKRAKARLFNFLSATFILTDLLSLGILLIVGWFVIGGAEGNVGGLALVFIAAPGMATHLYVILVLLALTRRAERRSERERLLGRHSEG